LFHGIVKLVVRVLHENLMATSNLELLDLQAHLANTAASVFKPHCFGGQVAVKLVLFGIALKQLGLGQEVVVSFHFVLNIHFVGIFDKLTSVLAVAVLLIDGFGHIWRDANKVLVASCLLKLLLGLPNWVLSSSLDGAVDLRCLL